MVAFEARMTETSGKGSVCVCVFLCSLLLFQRNSLLQSCKAREPVQTCREIVVQNLKRTFADIQLTKRSCRSWKGCAVVWEECSSAASTGIWSMQTMYFRTNIFNLFSQAVKDTTMPIFVDFSTSETHLM